MPFRRGPGGTISRIGKNGVRLKSLGQVTAPPVTPPVVVAPPSGNALSGVTWTQPVPVWPGSENSNRLYGVASAVGGIGPFKFTSADLPARYRLNQQNGEVRNYYSAPGAGDDTFTLTCTDSTGASVSHSATIVKYVGAGPYLSINGLRTIHNCHAGSDLAWEIGAFGGDHTSSDTITINDPSGLFVFQYGAIAVKGFANAVMPPVGTYSIGVTATSASQAAISGTLTFSVVAYTPIVSLQASLATVSTSLPVGWAIGTLQATTPNNAPSFALTNDGGGAVAVNRTTGALSIGKTPPATAGTVNITATVTDKLATKTTTFSVTVLAGTVLPAGNLTLPDLNPSIINSGRGQFIGTASVVGVTGTKQWLLQQNNTSSGAALLYGLLPRYAFNPTTQVLSAPGMLSFQTDAVTLTCTDGVSTCTRTFNISVAEAPVTTYWVGRGMAAAHGAQGMETFAEARALCMFPHSDKKLFNVMADADDDYYANDNGVRTSDSSLRYAWNGPVEIVGVAANGKPAPRLGGPIGSVSGGYDMRGKGFIVSGDGDMTVRNIIGSDVHSNDLSKGIEFIRKDETTYGNLSIYASRISDCNQGVECGIIPGNIFIDSCEIVGCGTAHVSTGACHNLYIGRAWSFTLQNSYVAGATDGHNVKSRAEHTLIQGNRIYETERGSASALIDICDGGQAVVQNNIMQKGAMAQSVSAVLFCAEMNPDNGDPHPINDLVVTGNTISILCLGGNHWGVGPSNGATPLRKYNAQAPDGTVCTASFTNNSVYMTPTSILTSTSALGVYADDPNAPNKPTVSGTITLASPPALDFTRPTLPGTMPRIKPYWWITEYTGDNLGPYYQGVQIDPGLDDIRLPASTAVGTTISTATAYGCPAYAIAGGTVANPFGAGTTWSVDQTQTYYASTSPWAPVGRYTVTSNADGTATLKTGAALSAGVDFVQLLATGPTGTKCLNRFTVVVS